MQTTNLRIGLAFGWLVALAALVLALASCARCEPVRKAQPGPLRLTKEWQLAACVGSVIEVEGTAVDRGSVAVVECPSMPHTFVLNDMARWPDDVECRRVLLSGRVVRRPVDTALGMSLPGYNPPPQLDLAEVTWKVLEPEAVEDGKAVFKLTSADQFKAHEGSRVEVEGTADPEPKGFPRVEATSFSIYVDDPGHWPDIVRGKRVILTGRLLLHPPFGSKDDQSVATAPYYALHDVRWKLAEPLPAKAAAVETPFRLTNERETEGQVGKIVTLEGVAKDRANGGVRHRLPCLRLQAEGPDFVAAGRCREEGAGHRQAGREPGPDGGANLGVVDFGAQFGAASAGVRRG